MKYKYYIIFTAYKQQFTHFPENKPKLCFNYIYLGLRGSKNKKMKSNEWKKVWAICMHVKWIHVQKIGV